jgi:hypothetical protein
MFEVPNHDRWRLPDGTPQPHDSAMEEILANWMLVAAIAWDGNRQEGRGTVIVDEQGARYRSGSICECHRNLVEEYDPASQAVVALIEQGSIRAVHVVAGWPAPPDAALVTPAERFRLTAH